MNIYLLRHGEARDNVKKLISDKEIYWSLLTKKGVKTVLESINYLPKNIDEIYVSPFPRTIQTAHLVYKKYPNANVKIDNRIREIDSGKYSHKKNNKDLDNTRNKQINGDYFVRLGDYGENRYEIETRLASFLEEIYNSSREKTVLVVSHGSVISYIKRILGLKTPHIKTGKLEKFENVDFKFFFEYNEKLKLIK